MKVYSQASQQGLQGQEGRFLQTYPKIKHQEMKKDYDIWLYEIGYELGIFCMYVNKKSLELVKLF